MIGKINLHDFVDATRSKRELEAQIKILDEQIAQAEKKLLAEMTDAGVQRVTVDDVTVYIHRQLWASKNPNVTDEEAAEAIKLVGLDDMIKPKFNANTMSSYIRELDGQGRPIPDPLLSVLSITEKFSVRMVGDRK